MNIQQLRYVFEVARHRLNVSEAAERLFTSQPGVSKQIRLLEDELGIEIFVRHGKRLVGITEPGRQVLGIAGRILQEVDNLREVGAEFSNEATGSLSIAFTHTQARYALPRVVQAFMQRYPKVKLSFHQGNPRQVCEYVLSGEADIAIATEAIAEHEDIVMLPCYQWNRCIIAPPRHPILAEQPLTLEAIARYPVVTYDFAKLEPGETIQCRKRWQSERQAFENTTTMERQPLGGHSNIDGYRIGSNGVLNEMRKSRQ